MRTRGTEFRINKYQNNSHAGTRTGSRTASRVLVELLHTQVKNVDDIYSVAKSIEWDDVFSPDSTFVVRFSGKGSGVLDTQFGALKVKDAIVDRFREADLKRPNIDKDNPDVKIDAHLHSGNLTIAIDVSGAIHQRGYRTAHGVAPIRENLAATMVLRSGWQGDSTLIDPVCGSGTLLIEAGLIATNTAPALNRSNFGFEHWFEHIPKKWQTILDEAKAQSEKGKQQLAEKIAENTIKIIGFEADSNTLKLANENIENAGLKGLITLHHSELSRFKYKESFGTQGMIVCNPPYGSRLGEVHTIGALYDRLGQVFKSFPASTSSDHSSSDTEQSSHIYQGWRMAIISGLADTPKHLHLSADKVYSLPNGPIDSKLYLFSREERVPKKSVDNKDNREGNKEEQDIVLESDVLMFANRLKKNLKATSKIIKKRNICAYMKILSVECI